MKTIKQTILLVSASLLAGCGSFVPVAKIDELPPDQKHAVHGVKIYNTVQLMNKKFEVLSIVEGNSCQNKLYDPPATRANAIEQTKFFAHELGANGITNVQCGSREGTSLRTNCWELISCTAEAIKVEEQR
jgi:uncharacterized protein YbjQ (UPF0145 family)